MLSPWLRPTATLRHFWFHLVPSVTMSGVGYETRQTPWRYANKRPRSSTRLSVRGRQHRPPFHRRFKVEKRQYPPAGISTTTRFEHRGRSSPPPRADAAISIEISCRFPWRRFHKSAGRQTLQSPRPSAPRLVPADDFNQILKNLPARRNPRLSAEPNMEMNGINKGEGNPPWRPPHTPPSLSPGK